MPLHPTSELVAVAWIKTIAGINPSNVATTLPQSTTSWSTDGFVQVSTVGGTPGLYLPVAAPAVSVDCWAVNPSSGRPPWGKANQLAESIRAAVYDPEHVQQLVTGFPGDYNDARVLGAWLLTEPRRMRDDDASYARYTFDLSLNWIEVPA